VGDARDGELTDSPLLIASGAAFRFSSSAQGDRMNPIPIAGTETRFNESQAQFLAIYPLARRAANVRSAAALTWASVAPVEREDIEQEALAAVWQALPHYDPSRASLRTFVECVVATRIVSAVRATHRVRALHSVDLAVDHCADPVSGRHELRIDIERLLRCCPDDERHVALLLMEHSPAEASRILGVARSTLYLRIQRLRLRFATAGLGHADCASSADIIDAIRQRVAEVGGSPRNNGRNPPSRDGFASEARPRAHRPAPPRPTLRPGV
jgi:RNA polymerase sigma factor (sigma-70 family)